MLTVTTKVQYGILAVVELAKHHGKGLLKIRDIAERGNIPKKYLEQILNRLHKQGIVKSTRGSKGGYELMEDPRKMSLLCVLDALDGKIQLDTFHGPESVEALYEEVAQHAKRTLDVTLAEIVFRQRRLDQQVMFHI
jgi:Rrf2 family protein